MSATVGIDSDFAYAKILSSFISCFPAYSSARYESEFLELAFDSRYRQRQ
jgi:hypothetical protein